MTTLLLGDSLTAWHDWSGAVGTHRNHGIPGDTTDGLLMRLEHALASRPDRVIVMIGINDLLQYVPLETVKANFTRLLERLERHGLPLYLLSVLPVEETPYTELINENVIVLNRWLKSQAREFGAVYVDLHTPMSKGLGIVPEYTDDGVHLTEAGYAAWERVLREFLKD